MGPRRLRLETEHLVDGLTFDERLSRLEGLVLGDDHRAGLDRDHDETRRRLEDLESIERRRSLPWYLRWWVTR